MFKERITAHTHLIFLFLQDCGYNFARPYFQAMIQTEKLRKVLRPPDKVSNRLSTQKLIPETSSLTDLANMMSSADISDITEPITVFDITHALGKSKQRHVLQLIAHRSISNLLSTKDLKLWKITKRQYLPIIRLKIGWNIEKVTKSNLRLTQIPITTPDNLFNTPLVAHQCYHIFLLADGYFLS